jgi:hypothetical protein
MRGMLGWFKQLMVPAAKAHTSRKITAGAMVAASISGFRFVQPVDGPAQAFRYICLTAGGIGLHPVPKTPS